MIFSKIKIWKESIAILLFLLFIFLFLFSPKLKDLLPSQLPDNLFNLNSIFLSIILEATPFILIGVFFSAFIQSFVSEQMIQRVLPKHAILAMFPAACLGLFFPICECAIIPIVRRLIKKGLPQHIGMVFMLTVPILNPIVFLSTYYAFQNNQAILYGRMGVSFIVAITVGLLIYLFFNDKKIVKHSLPINLNPSENQKNHGLKGILNHASVEFFETGKYLIVGALCASFFQTFLDRSLLSSIGSNSETAPIIMMGFSYVLSLCSEADAFVASSFQGTFTTGALIAFLVMGPMLDIKNTIMLFAYFRTKFVLIFILITCLCIYSLSRFIEILL
ncbi:permease [Heyndrickxia oleronia]|uniref:Permease n=1 Tax=Heyndrickxia oleronia TaxID=38875 RepID=A0AAW6T3K6_9BACI|nr:permease [Heyndrickxia oleronia]MDH5164138.1 permease [Heyndrickxia oleronia]